MAQTSRHISIGKSPDFVMSQGEIEINHQAVLKVYRIDSGSPVLIDSRAPFDRSLAVVIETLKQKSVAYGWNEDCYVTGNDSTPYLITIVTNNFILSLIYKLEPKLTKKQSEDLTGEFKRFFEGDLPKSDAGKGRVT